MAARHVLRDHNVSRPRLVISEAKNADLKLAQALAALEKETGFPQRNIFGCDWGAGRAFCHMRVTRRRVRRLLKSDLANGVGWTQLTFPPFVRQARRMGGAHKPKFQMRVGFAHLAWLIDTYGEWGGFRRYNGSGEAAERYATEAVDLARKWRGRLR